MRIPFIGGAYEGVSKSANAQTCVNLYVEPDQTDPEGSVLVGTPGRQLVKVDTSDFDTLGIYGFTISNNFTLAAAGDCTSPSTNLCNIKLTDHGLY
ncbi:MAG: hypothetical protein ACYSUV_21365 [Planctomycetota bacterium]|jgi:hypothetical protein